jgi:TRAP-type mannitol/chloroaromatic compound transport system substrate-binding protein
MIRRNFLRNSIGGSALFALATPVAAQSSPNLKLLSVDVESADALKTRIETATDKAMPIDVQSVADTDATSILASVASGDADMAMVPLHRFVDQNLAFGMFDSMPFGLSAGELEGWISASEGGEMLNTLMGEFGVSARLVNDKGTLPMWSRAPISDAAAFAGLKIGSRGLGILSLKAMGATTVMDLNDASVSWADLDVLDGVSVIEMQSKGLIDTFAHLTRVNPNTPTALSVLIVNDATMAGLSDSAKVVLERACSAELAASRGKAFHDNATALAGADGNLTAYDLPDDVWTGLNAGAKTVLKEIFESGQSQASVVDAYVYFLTDVAGWSEIGEAAYYAGRKRLTAL